jgi:mRNA interferase RelE/StbE
MYRCLLKPRAERDLKKLRRYTPSEFDRIHRAILDLRENPRPPQAKPLRGPDFWSRRVGDYRIVYTIDDDARVVTIYRVRHRREVYRDLFRLS